MDLRIIELLKRARAAIESGEDFLRAAAEDLAAAQAQGATQRHIAEGVGKSAAWVNRLLRWRDTGYHDAKSKARRQRARSVQCA